MAGQDDPSGGEKTQEPTPHKLAEARRKGDVARSMDLSGAAAYLGLLAVSAVLGVASVEMSGASLAGFLTRAETLSQQVTTSGAPALVGRHVAEILRGSAALLLAPTAGALICLLAQRAFAPSLEKLTPKLSRIDPIANAKQKFGVSGLVEFAKTAVKMVLIGCLLVALLLTQADQIIGSARAGPGAVVRMMGALFIQLLALVTVIAIVIGLLDFAWQSFDHRRKLRMSFQELKDEAKTTEGDPHIKAQRRARAEDIATNRMLTDVPGADVVITNPTHYAVALKWARTRGSAPTCVAKGKDEIALQIREIAAQSGVPVREDPPTARSLYATTRIGAEIDEAHYRPVAAAIRFADRMRRLARARGS
ncbi:MAG: flagellar type III secretion system protein FlhB [Pseudomonadota bacterium]